MDEEFNQYTILALLCQVDFELSTHNSVDAFVVNKFKKHCDAYPNIFGSKGSKLRRKVQSTRRNWKARGIPKGILNQIRSATEEDFQILHRIQSHFNQAQVPEFLSVSKMSETIDGLIVNPKDAVFSSALVVDAASGRGQEDLANLQHIHVWKMRGAKEYLENRKSNYGQVDKLRVAIPVLDPRSEDAYEAWLQPEGNGIFIRMPKTSPSFFYENERSWTWDADLDEKANFTALDKRGFEAYDAQMSGKTNAKDNTMIMHFSFPPSMKCSNKTFNKDEYGRNPENSISLRGQEKINILKISPLDDEDFGDDDDDDDAEPVERITHVFGWMVWEMEIVNKENITRSARKKSRETLANKLSKLSIG